MGSGARGLNRWPMSALGQKQTLQIACSMSALPPKVDIAERTVMSALCQKQREQVQQKFAA
jgi:hypothetical protein